MIAPFIESVSLAPEKNFPAASFLIGRIPGLVFPSDRKEAFLMQQPLHRKMLEELIGFFRSSTGDANDTVAPVLASSSTSLHTPALCAVEPSPSSPVASFKKSLFPSHSVLSRVPFVFADQCHGSEIALVVSPFLDTQQIDQVDGLMTAHSGVILGITVADCAPVWIVEKTGRAGALLHSGKKGTEAGIVPKAILKMQEEFQIDPNDLIVTIGPCIRPPCYEIDFAKMIREQAAKAGVKIIQDKQICTACHLDRYYSYRREKGKTGHMLAVLLLQNSTCFAEEGKL